MPTWLADLWWREAWLTLEAAEPAVLPPYLGSTLRGALGHLLRNTLCHESSCGHECQRPVSCDYHSLFEKRAGAKPLILLAPPPAGLEDIALGGPVNLPYRTGPPRNRETIPTLRCESASKLDTGARLRFGLRLMGVTSNTLPTIVDAIGKWGLSIGGAQFFLASASDGAGRLLYDRRFPAVPVQVPTSCSLRVDSETACRLRIAFLLPTVFKLDREPTFSPEDFAARFFEHSIGRAAQMYWTCSGGRAPWVDTPTVSPRLSAHRLFHYELHRHSFRQDKWLDFDGIVGYLDLTGDIGTLMPWARAAEALHFGQKAAFGLGKVRVLVLN